MAEIKSKSANGPFGRIKNLLRQFRHDLREPIEGTESLPRRKRIAARLKFLFRRYGWKLVAGVFLFYLIRDSIVYIIIPYLLARHIIAG